MKNDIEIITATRNDIAGILELQGKYLVSNLTESEKKDGFVTTPFTTEQIERIIQENGLFVAKSDGRIIAYVYAGTWEYFSQWAIFPLMTSRFVQCSFKGQPITVTNSFQYGPICIDKEFRGTGVLNEIFEVMRLYFKTMYPISITFINKINGRSIKAHTQKLGWEIIDEFAFNGNNFFMLALDMNDSVLKKQLRRIKVM